MAMDSTVKLVLNVDDQNASSTLTALKGNIVGVGAAIGGLGASTKVITDITTAAIDLGLQFDETFAKVSTLFGGVEVDTESLKTQILDLSTQTGIAATELNEGLYSALSAGIPVTEDMTEAMNFLEASARLATAGFTTTEKAVDIATTVLNSYGMEVDQTDRVMNTLIETQNAGKTTVDELASSLGKAIPAASTLGVNFEELSASVAVLTANGIGTAETMTKLKQLFVELNDPASGINGLFMDIADTTFPEFIKNGGSLTEGLKMMKKELDKNGETWGQYLSSVEAVDAATILMKDDGAKLTEVYQRMTDDVSELDGAYEDMQTPARNLAKIHEGLNNTLIEMGTSILETVNPALEFLAENIDVVAPLVLSLTLGVAALVAVMSTVKIVRTFTNGITTLGTEAKVASKSVVSLGTSLVTKLANPWGIALAGMTVVAYTFRDDIAVVMKDVTESIVNMVTDSTEAQRNFKSDVEEINKNLGEELVQITSNYADQVESGELTSSEAREKIAEDSVEARLASEEDYNERYSQLQKERIAEEEVNNAKATGKKKELLDASESELLELRKEYDSKNEELAKTNSELESATDEETRKKKKKELEELTNDLNEIQAQADEEMLLLKTGNRAKDEEDFVSYTDDLKSDLADMTETEKQNYEDRAEAGKSFRDGEYSAQLYAYDQTKQSFKTANEEMVQIETDAQGNISTIITDAQGNQIEATKTAKGEISTIITDANGAEIEGTKRQNKLVQELEQGNWAELLTIVGGGTDDIETAIDNMWAGILEQGSTSNKKVQNQTKESGKILAKQWRENGLISKDEYKEMIDQLDDVTSNAVAEADNVKAVDVDFDKEHFKTMISLVPEETRKKITEANSLKDVEVGGKYKMLNTLLDVVDYNPSSVIVPVSYSGDTVPDEGVGPVAQHAKGAIVSGTEYAMIGESGPELVLPLNMQGAQFLEQLIPSGSGGGGDTIVYNIEVRGGGTAQENVDAFDKAMGRKINRRSR